MAIETFYKINGWPDEKITFNEQLVVISCPTCHIPHAIPDELNQRMLKYPIGSYPANFVRAYCPNGHEWHYLGKNEDVAAARARAETAERELKFARNQRDQARTEAEHNKRKASARLGALTKIRNRIKAGICPVQSCRANLGDRVREHIANEHPDFAMPEAE